jgi:hypothetical protein
MLLKQETHNQTPYIVTSPIWIGLGHQVRTDNGDVTVLAETPEALAAAVQALLPPDRLCDFSMSQHAGVVPLTHVFELSNDTRSLAEARGLKVPDGKPRLVDWWLEEWTGRHMEKMGAALLEDYKATLRHGTLSEWWDAEGKDIYALPFSDEWPDEPLPGEGLGGGYMTMAMEGEPEDE